MEKYQYLLNSKLERPIFPFMLRILSSDVNSLDYRLYSNFDDALDDAYVLSLKHNCIVAMHEAFRSPVTGEYFAPMKFSFSEGRGKEELDRSPIHFKFYMDAGSWINHEICE